MKRYFLSFACFIAAVVFFTSCKNVLKGEGGKTTSNPTVSSFNAVAISASLKATVVLQDGTQPGIQLSGYENIIKHIKVKTENNLLKVYTDLDDNWTIDNNDLRLQVTLPAITALSLEGATDADIHGNIAGAAFKMSISGASTVIIDNINVDNFSSEISGAGDIIIKSGSVKSASYEINGAGKIKAFPLQSGETTATISGAGTGEVTATQKLKADVNGAGTIKYKGHPVVTKQVSGVGTISEAN